MRSVLVNKIRKPLAELRMRHVLAALAFLGVAIAYWAALPDKLFGTPVSPVLLARDGQLLSASIAGDGQWRFPVNDSVPHKFARAIIVFEDKRFFYHPGVDPLSAGRALFQNIKGGKVVSGASTITMQVIRLSRSGASRSVLEKLMEMMLATRLEWRHSKAEILSLYAAHAPFGGNVVGLDAACWRYFGRSAQQLSWAEAALLAVLPNAPSLIHPGKNREVLKEKRDKLLDRLYEAGDIDSLTCALGKQESIPQRPKALPRMARHLLPRAKGASPQQNVLRSTIDLHLQQRVEQVVGVHHAKLKNNQVFNAAVLVLDVSTGGVLAYAGNVDPGSGVRGEEVDVITSPRSTGSILKPFLYAAALDEGLILPKTLLPDIPVFMNGFSPQNFSKQYDGAVAADQALIRSLNVPSVFLLRDYRYEKFYALLRNMGLRTLRHPADHYGLSLVLGGAEGTLWDITGMYASMARTLNHYFEHPGRHRYTRTDFHSPLLTEPVEDAGSFSRESASWLSASSIYLTFDALQELYRPEEQAGWKYFATSKKIAWKTGTSFGFRDGWAIGVTPEYAVGVWIGNADGEGRPGLTGTHAAAPLMFDVFSLLPSTTWFQAPQSELYSLSTCRSSGQRISMHCDVADTVQVPHRGLETKSCTYHHTVHVSKDRRYRLHANCADLSQMYAAKWFVLPPVQEYYYKIRNISYQPLPPWALSCQGASHVLPMELVYPESAARIFVPRNFDGKPGGAVFELAHRDGSAEVFWHLDGAFMGVTKGTHRFSLNPSEGKHVLTLVDSNGHSFETEFTVISTL